MASRAKGTSITGYTEISAFVEALQSPRKIMLMLKAGAPVDAFIATLNPLLAPGDIVIDGGNSHYLDTARRVRPLLNHRGSYLSAPGYPEAKRGAYRPIHHAGRLRRCLAAPCSHLYRHRRRVEDGSACTTWVGPGGAGHFVKMVHNGIEYGDMQLICETYHFMKAVLAMSADEIHEVFGRWNGGELSSYLIEITAAITGYRDEKRCRPA
ncbi:MAG: hypothetical protein JKP90_20670 [Desulfofustis sp. PB-SRB1]|nr:hypothetical protein [Desulfofustis sp. PB-SRB1]